MNKIEIIEYENISKLKKEHNYITNILKTIKNIQLFIKRIFDIVFSTIGIVVLIPISFIVFIINVLTKNNGPIFYKHLRVGKNGKKFLMYKYRTMYDGADKDLEKIFKQNKEYEIEWEKNFKLQKDPRITGIGIFLRKTSIDEIPQFINVLKGDMSIVGPRPVTEKELIRFGEKKALILSMKPGITGYWATHGRTNTTYEERVLMEEKYVNNFNMFLDFRILLRTIITVIRKEGAL